MRFNRFLALVYLVMAVGMAITALVATSVSTNEELMKRILFDPWFTFGLFMLQIIVVVWLSAAVMRMSAGLAFLLFLFYSALTGLALSSIFIYYSQSTIAYTFWVAAGMFLFSSIVGFFIKGDLSGLGRFLMLALLGWLFGWIFVLFFPFSAGLNQADEFYRHPALRGADGLGYQPAETAFYPAGGQAGHGRAGGHRRAGTLPGLHQPVLAAAAHFQALNPGRKLNIMQWIGCLNKKDHVHG